MTTISKDLAQSISLAVAKAYGVCASIEYTIRPKTKIIEGRTVNQHDTYTVSFRKEVKKQSNFHVTDDYICVPIKSIEKTTNVMPVFNIKVEDDNSYTANNAIVHNCQGFSFAGKQLAFDDPRSRLFFVFVEILNHVKSLNPSVKFLLENVRMKKEYIQVINDCLDVEPILINSALVSAQNRQRLY